MTDQDIARIAHEANRAWCQHLGDMSQVPWDEAPEWQKDSALKGVCFVRDNPSAPESASHDSWMAAKLDDGWVWGSVKDAEAKTHPCLVAFNMLPPEQQFKDKLFVATVKAALKGHSHEWEQHDNRQERRLALGTAMQFEPSTAEEAIGYAQKFIDWVQA